MFKEKPRKSPKIRWLIFFEKSKVFKKYISRTNRKGTNNGFQEIVSMDIARGRIDQINVKNKETF